MRNILFGHDQRKVIRCPKCNQSLRAITKPTGFYCYCAVCDPACDRGELMIPTGQYVQTPPLTPGQPYRRNRGTMVKVWLAVFVVCMIAWAVALVSMIMSLRRFG